jgi:pyruvate dehydrogenase E2 component (dihydrolipoamide acetyltransferase)
MLKRTDVIMPALGMVQETGTVLRWMVTEGQPVKMGEPLMEVETDKAAVEIEAPASGVLSHVTAHEGDEVPVGTVIAVILGSEEIEMAVPQPQIPPAQTHLPQKEALTASPLAVRMAAENNLDLSQIKPGGGRVEKADVQAYLQAREEASPSVEPAFSRLLASPKARRLASETGIALSRLHGSGPNGAILAVDVLSAAGKTQQEAGMGPTLLEAPLEPAGGQAESLSTTWRIMAQRTTASWTTAPHFYLIREVNASRLSAWRAQTPANAIEKITYTDLLVRLVGAALRAYPRVNASIKDGNIYVSPEINIGLAVAVEDGLVVPVIRHADELSVDQIAVVRRVLVERARAGKLRPEDISGGTFTISNLGMYGVDAFNAVLNPPQAAILAVGRIVERVIAVNSQPVVAPMMILSASFDHRVVDGARGAQFLEMLANFIEEPLKLLS